MERTDEAITLFKKQYGKTPKSLGFTEISIYEKQHAFLYAKSLEVIEAYKTQQNILRWIITWFVVLIVIAVLIWFVALAEYKNPMHPLCIACYIFYGVWVVLLIVMDIKVKKAEKLIKMGKNITYLNYSK